MRFIDKKTGRLAEGIVDHGDLVTCYDFWIPNKLLKRWVCVTFTENLEFVSCQESMYKDGGPPFVLYDVSAGVDASLWHDKL